jgi:hypothetical protein
MTPWQDVNVSALLVGSGLELDYQISGHPAAVFHLNALCPGPLADLDGVQTAHRSATAAAGWLAAAAADPAGSIHVLRQRLSHVLGVLGVQIDLIFGAVQPEADGTFGGAAVKVIDEQGLYLLSYGRPSLLTDLWRTGVCSSSRTGVQPGRRTQPLAACTSRCRSAGTAFRLNR